MGIDKMEEKLWSDDGKPLNRGARRMVGIQEAAVAVGLKGDEEIDIVEVDKMISNLKEVLMQKRGLALLLALVMLLGAGMPAVAWADDAADEKQEEKIVRLSGTNRYETAVDVSKDVFQKADVAIVASGENFPDALAGGQLALAVNGPILLTEKGKLPEATTKELADLKTKTVYILGGTATVSAEVESALKKMNLEVKRLEGTNRYETALKIAAEARLESGIIADTTIVASGLDDAYADALSSGGVVALKQYSLALSSGNELPNLNTKKWLALGGTRYLPLENNEDKVERIDGKNRYETALKLAKEYFKDPKVVVLASGENFADALTAVSVADKYQAPILLTAKKGIDKDTKAYIEKSAEKVILVGGESWIPDSIVADLKLKAVTPKITFDFNYEKGPENKVIQTDENGNVGMVLPKREGYVFRGWNTKKDGKGDPVNLYEKSFKEDTTLYAKWEEGEEVRLTLDFAPGTRIFALKKGETWKQDNPEREGQVFEGWVRDVGGNMVKVDLIAGLTVDKDMTVTARWTPGVTIKLNHGYKKEGEDVVETLTLKKGDKLPAPAEEPKLTPTRDGYRFDKWELEGSEEDVTNIIFTKDTVLTAKWEKIPVVTLNLGYTTNEEPKKLLVTDENKLPQGDEDKNALNPERKDFSFIGWFRKDGDTPVDIEKDTFDKDTTLTAKWGVTVTLHPNYGDEPEVKEIVVAEGGKISESEEALKPTRDGYTLKGWSKTKEGEVIDLKTTTFKKATTLYAIWTQDSGSEADAGDTEDATK